MTELKNCPFCGDNHATTTYTRDGRLVVCTSCGAKSGNYYHGPKELPSADERAIAAWNRRASQAAPAPSDGTCAECGCAPVNADSLCATCVDERRAPAPSDALREAAEAAAWNDAIEAAYQACLTCDGALNNAGAAAVKIRALRRAAPTEGEA